MNTETLSAEERILRSVKKVLANVAKDTFTRPGHSHPLSDETVQGIRECFGLIAARERELAEAAGRSMNQRPRYVDEPAGGGHVVIPLDRVGRTKPGKPEEQD